MGFRGLGFRAYTRTSGDGELRLSALSPFSHNGLTVQALHAPHNSDTAPAQSQSLLGSYAGHYVLLLSLFTKLSTERGQYPTHN